MTILNILLQQMEVAQQVTPNNEKSFVVVAVIGVLFAGITTYLIILDRKIKKLED